jgi:hypothetical protein
MNHQKILGYPLFPLPFHRDGIVQSLGVVMDDEFTELALSHSLQEGVYQTTVMVNSFRLHRSIN